MDSNKQQAYRKTAAQIVKILSKKDGLRQYQISKELCFPQHNDWVTHTVLNRMIEEKLIYAVSASTLNVDGTLSKRKYRHFHILTEVRVRKRDRIMAFISSLIQFPQVAY
jgi:hypothetical protein